MAFGDRIQARRERLGKTNHGFIDSIQGDYNDISNQVTGFIEGGIGKGLTNLFDQKISDGLNDLISGVSGIRTSNIPEITAEVFKNKEANREARSKLTNDIDAGGSKRHSEGTADRKIYKYPRNFITEGMEDDATDGMANYMHFRSLPRKNTTSKEEVYDIFLYVPDQLADSVSVEVTSAEKGLIEGAAQTIAHRFSSGEWVNLFADKSELKEIIKQGLPGANILKAGVGKTINPLKFQMFDGVPYRKFTYNFNFYPMNVDDSERIREICYAFRKSLLPGTEGDQSRTYTFPNEWAIRYHGPISKWIDYPMVCLCTNAEVDWANTGEFVHHTDGAPVAINLGVSFVELTTLDRDKYDQRVSGYIAKDSDRREKTQEGGSAPDIKNTQAAYSQDIQATKDAAAAARAAALAGIETRMGKGYDKTYDEHGPRNFPPGSGNL